ncbi:hypothetical protein VTK73DRAFT_7718 [Phialemonium thermophilum]|uniref:Alcohol dehydrogenase-like N-terminal domain-containing protein n=1 Tax=Phialemonium thermophilum TaxID=223376 RepID=A0ABR3WDK3_9PEZI
MADLESSTLRPEAGSFAGTRQRSRPRVQTQLLLYQPRQQYELHHEADIPALEFGELMVEVLAIGLNPIDWKSAAYGFALPSLPCLNGREFVGRIVEKNVDPECGYKIGDLVLAVSTDYRDFRKSAFQQYAVVCCFNAIKVPQKVNPERVASLGVGFVAASIALGVCLGIDFPSFSHYPPLSLLSVAQGQPREEVPSDVAAEVFEGIPPSERPKARDWVLIYGASSVTAQLCIQLVKMAGLRVIAVADAKKHGDRLRALDADVIVDRADLDAAAREVASHAQGGLRFALDMVGKETAAWCQGVLDTCSRPPSPEPQAQQPRDDEPASQSSNQQSNGESRSANGVPVSHLVCMTGEPKTKLPHVRTHKVPIKLFHVNRRLGSRLSKWLYRLLDADALKIPETRVVDGGLSVVNSCLDLLKNGEVSGSRVVVRMNNVA